MPLPGHTKNGAMGRDMAPWHRAGNALGIRPWASTLGPVSLAPSPKFVGHALHGKSAITNGCHHPTSNVVVMLEPWAIIEAAKFAAARNDGRQPLAQ